MSIAGVAHAKEVAKTVKKGIGAGFAINKFFS